MAVTTPQRDSQARRGPSEGERALRSLFAKTDGSGPENGSFYFGVDPGTVRVSVGVVGPDGFVAARTHSFTRHKPRSLDRLAAIRGETDVFLRELAAEYPPAFVLVEEPGGQHVEPQLSYAVGCILSCVPGVGPGSLIPVSSWKLEATGHGYRPGTPRSASKAERRKAEKARLLRWAQQHGYEGDLEDEGDAVGIAFACRSLHAPAPVQLALT